MSSEPQEGSVREQLSAAEGTIVQNEEELCRQRRLLDSSWKPQLQLHHIVLPQHWVTEDEDLCNQQRNFRVELEKPDSPLYKEELEEPEPSLIKEKKEGFYNSQLDLKQETDTVMEIPTDEEDENSEADLNNQSFNVTDSQDEEGNQHEESTSTTDEETDPQNRDQRKRRDRRNVQSVDSSHMSEVEEVKHKWKSLRDTYTRKKHEEDCRSGQAAKQKKPWKFMKVMEFLATSTEFRSDISHENMDEGVEQVVVQKDVSDREASSSTSSGSTFSSPTVTRSTSNKRKRPETPDLLVRYLLSKEARENEKEERRREKEEHREQRREQQNDENYLFVLGLIPALRRLSPAVQSSVKLRIHQLLHDAEFGQASSAFFSQQSPVSYHQLPPQTPPNNGCSTTSWLP
ncbi:uncharacterized protein LOC101164420 isoform X13 [Oryzias latipes]